MEEAGCHILAFRAGGFKIGLEIYHILQKNGILCSANYNLSEADVVTRLSPTIPPLNDICQINDIYELPVTNYLIRDIRKFFRYIYKPMQLCCTPFASILEVLKQAKIYEMETVVIVCHNFEFLDRDHPDWLERPFRVKQNLVQNFLQLCNFLQKNSDQYPTTTVSEFFQGIAKKHQTYHMRCPEIYLPKIYWPL